MQYAVACLLNIGKMATANKEYCYFFCIHLKKTHLTGINLNKVEQRGNIDGKENGLGD